MIYWFHLPCCKLDLIGGKRHIFNIAQFCCNFRTDSQCSVTFKQFCKIEPKLQQRDLGCGYWCFKKFPKGFRVCKPSFLQVSDPNCTGLLVFLVLNPFGMFYLRLRCLAAFQSTKLLLQYLAHIRKPRLSPEVLFVQCQVVIKGI